MQIHRLFDRADVPDSDQVAPNEIGLFQQGKVVKYVDHDGVVRTFGSHGGDGGDGIAFETENRDGWLFVEADDRLPDIDGRGWWGSPGIAFYANGNEDSSNNETWMMLNYEDSAFRVVTDNPGFGSTWDYGRSELMSLKVVADDWWEFKLGWDAAAGEELEIWIDTGGGGWYADFDGGDVVFTDADSYLFSGGSFNVNTYGSGFVVDQHSSGSIYGGTIWDAGSWLLRTHGGAIDLDTQDGGFSIDSGSGDTNIAPSGGGDVNLSGNGGNVAVHLAAGKTFKVLDHTGATLVLYTG